MNRVLQTMVLAFVATGCGHATTAAREPVAKESPAQRTFTRVAVLDDGSMEIDGKHGTSLSLVREAVPAGEAKHWLIVASPASPRAMGTDAALSDVSRESGWYMTITVFPQPGASPHVSDLRAATLGTDDALSIGSQTVMSIDDAAALLPDRSCKAGEGIGLRNDGANAATLFHAALRFAQAGCVVTVVQGPPGITAAPTPEPR